MTTKKQKSPCIDMCKFSGPKGWCLGCGRTRGECQKWKNLKPYDKKNLEKSISSDHLEPVKVVADQIVNVSYTVVTY